MKLIVGLGNPGKRYNGTRHNIGRAVVESLVASESCTFSEKKSLKASVAQCCFDEQEIILAFPHTYMNLSGEAVFRLVKHFEIDAVNELLVVVDDLALPFSRLRLRGGGSSGGHNGLRSVENILQANTFARLRIGVGHPGDGEAPTVSEYVLSRFELSEEKMMDGILERASQACRLWASQSLQEAMSDINTCE